MPFSEGYTGVAIRKDYYEQVKELAKKRGLKTAEQLEMMIDMGLVIQQIADNMDVAEAKRSRDARLYQTLLAQANVERITVETLCRRLITNAASGKLVATGQLFYPSRTFDLDSEGNRIPQPELSADASTPETPPPPHPPTITEAIDLFQGDWEEMSRIANHAGDRRMDLEKAQTGHSPRDPDYISYKSKRRNINN